MKVKIEMGILEHARQNRSNAIAAIRKNRRSSESDAVARNRRFANAKMLSPLLERIDVLEMPKTEQRLTRGLFRKTSKQ